MDHLESLRAFAKAVETGSLSAAARALETSLPSVSRQIAMLEKHLGARLLARTTRRMALTESGQAYYDRVKRILDDLAEADLSVTQNQSVPSGRLVISAPVLFGRMFIAPLLPTFLARFPEVHVSLKLSDRYVQLVEERVDVAIRIGDLKDSSLVSRRLGSFRRVICGAPSYFERMGTPRHPAELRDHDCLLYTSLVEADYWYFRVDGKPTAVPVNGCFRCDNQDAVLEVALQGIGLMLAPIWMVREYLHSGRLRQVLSAYQAPGVHIQAVFGHARLLSAKTRALVGYLADCWKDEDFDAELPRRRQPTNAAPTASKAFRCAPRGRSRTPKARPGPGDSSMRSA